LTTSWADAADAAPGVPAFGTGSAGVAWATGGTTDGDAVVGAPPGVPAAAAAPSLAAGAPPVATGTTVELTLEWAEAAGFSEEDALSL
jgi:hypothetical protein